MYLILRVLAEFLIQNTHLKRIHGSDFFSRDDLISLNIILLCMTRNRLEVSRSYVIYQTTFYEWLTKIGLGGIVRGKPLLRAKRKNFWKVMIAHVLYIKEYEGSTGEVSSATQDKLGFKTRLIPALLVFHEQTPSHPFCATFNIRFLNRVLLF